MYEYIYLQISFDIHTLVAIFLEFSLLFDPSREPTICCLFYRFLCSVMWTSLNALWLPQFHIPSSIFLRFFSPVILFFSSITYTDTLTYVCQHSMHVCIFYNFVSFLFFHNTIHIRIRRMKNQMFHILYDLCFPIYITITAVAAKAPPAKFVVWCLPFKRIKSLLWNVIFVAVGANIVPFFREWFFFHF